MRSAVMLTLRKFPVAPIPLATHPFSQFAGVSQDPPASTFHVPLVQVLKICPIACTARNPPAIAARLYHLVVLLVMARTSIFAGYLYHIVTGLLTEQLPYSAY